jgi:hypothetical protein
MNDRLDIKFYRRIYPDLRFLPDGNLQTHYNESGKHEGRIPNEDVLNDFINRLPHKFDHMFYKSSYSDVPNNELMSRVHYMTHGAKENRVYCRNMINKNHPVNTSQNIQDVTDDSKQTNIVHSDIVYNLIYNTTCKTTDFDESIQMVINQSYKNYLIWCYLDYTVNNSMFLKYSEENILYCDIKSKNIIPTNSRYIILNENILEETSELQEIHQYIQENSLDIQDHVIYNNVNIYHNIDIVYNNL